MPQIKKDCEINLQHPSYIKLYDILRRYEEPHLRDIFLQQVAYNCAIRLVALDFDLSINDPREEGYLFSNHQNLSRYGLDTFNDYFVVPDYNDRIVEYDVCWLNLFYPFFDEIKKNHNYNESSEFERYPKVQKPLTKKQRELWSEVLATHYNNEDDLVLPILERESNLPDELRQGNEYISYNALHITRAFYYFDAINFYNYTISMIERSKNLPCEKTNNSRHDNRYIKRFLNVITPYILKKEYLNLI